MPLQKQKISLPFSDGLNTKIDEKQKSIGTLQDIENALFDEPGKLKKRNGYDRLGVSQLSGSDISDAQRLTTFKDELCLFDKTSLFSFSESTNVWTNKGTTSNIFPETTALIRNSREQSAIDNAHVSGLNAYAWEDTRGGIRISVVDNATGNEIISDTEITSTGIRPRVQSVSNVIFFIYIDGTDIKYRTVNSISPDTIESEVTLVSGDVHASNKIYDAVDIQDRVFFCYNSSSGTLKIGNVQEDGTVSTIQEEAGESPSVCINLSTDSSFRVIISYYDGSDVKVIIRSFTLLANIVAPTSIETISDIVNVSAASSNNSDYTVLYEKSASNTYDHLIRKNTINLSASVGTAADFIRSCGLASKIFIQDSNQYVAALHQSTLQSTVFILNSDAEVVSKISQSLSGDLLNFGNLPKVSTISSTLLLVTSQVKGRIISEDNTIFSLLGVNSSKLNFGSDTRFDNAVLGEQLHVNGGLVQSYDGKEIVEHGFNIFPENLQDDSTATTGGSISDGNYQYLAVYSWTDNKGQQHRSAPSPALSITLSGGTATQTQTIEIPTLRITEKSNIVIELYRTEASGTIFYKATSISSPTYNDKTVDSLTIVDSISDTDLISREILYTTGGVLDNIAPPSASIIETFNNRIFLAGLQDKNKIEFSKIRNEASPVEFNDTLVINVNTRGGDITALSTLDDKLIIFKEKAIFFLSGDGPNNLGEQDTFIEPELVTDDVGCVTQNSIVRTPEGLMFKSQKGIYLVNRSLGVTYVGAPVEAFNDLNIKAANLVPTKNIAIFLTDKEALVFNYFMNKWGTFTNHSGISATTLNNIYYYIRDNSEVYKEASHFTDVGSFIKLKVETSWLSFSGIQGYQRIYRALVLGQYKSAHKLQIQVAYNFKDAFVQSKIIDTSDFTSDTVYGGDSPYGAGTPYGGGGNQYQARVNFKTQKCQSIKVKIEDSQSTNYGEGFELSNILFVVGAKRGEFKTDQARIYGTE